MKVKSIVLLIIVFVSGIAAGAFARGKKVDVAALFASKSKAETGKALLALAREQAGKGSWENIAVGRVYYLGGMKSEGQAIFDGIAKKEPSDWMRIGRIYMEAKEWSKAEAAFNTALAAAPKDAAWLAEIGGYYNLKGDHAKAEEMFRKSLELESNELWHTVNMAGSYFGVEPRGNS